MTKSLLAAIGSAVLLFTAAGCAKDSADQEVQVGVNLNGVIREKFYVSSSTLWKDPMNIPVCWQTSGFTREKGVVKDSVKKAWEIKAAGVRFSGWGNCTSSSPGIHIAIKNDPESGPHVKDMGNLIDGMDEGMVLDLGLEGEMFQNCHTSQAREDQCNRSVAVHEFGHALGFFHEQERKDTPSSCPDKDTSFPTQAGDKTIGKWDLMSIMNYCYPDRLEVYPDKLSALDTQGLIQMYPPIEEAAPADDEDTDGSPTTQSKGDDNDDEADASEDEEDEDEDDKPKKKRSTSSAAPTASAGCSAAPNAPVSSNLGWLFGVGLVLASRRRR